MHATISYPVSGELILAGEYTFRTRWLVIERLARILRDNSEVIVELAPGLKIDASVGQVLRAAGRLSRARGCSFRLVDHR